MQNAFLPADILVPREEYIKRWAVIACDQYTSEPEYWRETESLTENHRSALSLILPEIYLQSPDVDDRIKRINRCMEEYLNNDTFDKYKNSYIYIERTQSDGKLRCGLVGMIDLEQYDYSKGSVSPVRATEATITERIPPRIKIRENASLELPHIMILIDDESKTVIEPVGNDRQNMKLLYDTELIQGGGSIKGWLISDKRAAEIGNALSALGNKETYEKKYGLASDNPLVFAMGDGNHSLATAKAYYERLKAENPGKNLSRHPARYALAEIVNLHSEALEFEAIHRIITDTDADKLFEAMSNELQLSTVFDSEKQHFEFVTPDGSVTYYIDAPTSSLAVGSVQNFLDKYLKENGGGIDYIHGTDTLKRLVAEKNAIGFILPDISKSELFPTVMHDGALPRKTFSMGHAADKRYYMEARKIK